MLLLRFELQIKAYGIPSPAYGELLSLIRSIVARVVAETFHMSSPRSTANEVQHTEDTIKQVCYKREKIDGK